MIAFVSRWGAVLAALLILAAAAAGQDAARRPAVRITEVPPADPGGPDKVARIAGTADNACAECAVVVYARGDVWYVQPWTAAPYTDISGGRWAADIHLGSEYAALLVRRSFEPPARLSTLPPAGGDVLAVAVERGRRPAAPGGRAASGKVLRFSGYTWAVKTSDTPVGPGPNVFAGDNAWVDELGSLHLRIARNGDGWSCAEVVNEKSLGYGEYVFVVDAPELPPEAVLGLFSWDPAAPAEHFREWDFELSRWGDPKNRNSQFVVQPYTKPENIVRFDVQPGLATHSLRWTPGRLDCRSASAAPSGEGAVTYCEHSFTSGVPSPGAAAARLNFWLAGQRAPSLAGPLEVVIREFSFKAAE